MLAISRKQNEAVTIEPIEGLDPSLTLREVFAGGPIVLRVTHVGSARVRLVLKAPAQLKIMRTSAPPDAPSERTEASGESHSLPTIERRHGRPR